MILPILSQRSRATDQRTADDQIRRFQVERRRYKDAYREIKVRPLSDGSNRGDNASKIKGDTIYACCRPRTRRLRPGTRHLRTSTTNYRHMRLHGCIMIGQPRLSHVPHQAQEMQGFPAPAAGEQPQADEQLLADNHALQATLAAQEAP